MNGLDIALVALLGLLLLLGVIKGMARILIGTGALVVAFLLAAQFHAAVAARLGTWLRLPEPALMLVAYLVIFLGTMLAGGLVAFVTRRLLRAAMLTWADRLAGAALGLVAALLLAALLILPLVAYAPFGERALRTSTLAPYVAVVADLANRLVPEALSARYRERMERLRHYWHERWNGSAVEARARGDA